MKQTIHRLGLFLACFLAAFSTLAQQPAPGMESKAYNFSRFTTPQPIPREQWLKVNPEADLQHPEALHMPLQSPCSDCVEQLDQRTVNGRVFVNPDKPGETYHQTSLNALHYKNAKGQWVTVNHHLRPSTPGRFEAPDQWVPAGIDVNKQYTFLSDQGQEMRFNQWELWGTTSAGEKRLLYKANWDRRDVGEDGMMVHDLFPGIDAQILFLRGAIKTNFILRAALDVPYTTLWIRDRFSADTETSLSFEKGSDALQSADILIHTPGHDLRMGRAVSFPESDRKAFHYLNYLLEGSHVSIEVTPELFNNPSASYPIIIDPLVSSSNSVAQAAINYFYNASCNFDVSCDFPLTVNTPPNSSVTDITFNYNYIATFPCYMMDASNRMALANCISPNLPGYYWFCNTLSSGTCTGNNISFLSDIAPCVPAPSCPPVPLNFTLQFFKSCWGNTGCSNICVAAGTDFSITIQAHTLEFSNPVTPVSASPATVCVNGSSTLSTGGALYGVPPYTYVWSDNPGGTPVLGTGTSVTLPFNTVGTSTLYVMVTDACGTSISAPVSVTVVNGPTFTATPSAPSCPGGNNGSILVNPNGGGSFSYTLNPGGATANGPSATFNGLTPGTYTVGVSTNGAGACTATQVVVVPNPNPLIWNNVTGNSPLCGGNSNGSIQVSAGGGTPTFNYTLQPGNTTNANGLFSSLPGGTYTITATDAGGCTLSTVVTLNQPTAITWSTWNVVPVNCFGQGNGSITVAGSGGVGALTYTLMPGNISNATGVFSPLNGGSYTITVTDVNGCTASSLTTITEPPALVFQNAVSNPANCNGTNTGSLSTTATGGSGGLTYTLQPGNNTNSSGSFTGLGAGNYTITVTDANGCTNSTLLTVTQPSVLNWTSFTSQNVSCNGLNNGSINALAGGGTGLLGYTLMPGNISNSSGSFAGLAPGNYTVTVSDANNCTLSSSVSIAAGGSLNLNLDSLQNICCLNGNSGKIALSASGGIPAYTFTLMPGSVVNSTGTFTGLGAGTYTISCVDVNNCSATTIVSLNQPAFQAYVNLLNQTNPLCFNSGGSISVNVVSPPTTCAAPAWYVSSPMYYLYNSLQPLPIDSSATGVFINLAAGTYTVTYSDQNCQPAYDWCCPVLPLTLSIVAPPPVVVNGSVTLPTCFGGFNGQIQAAAMGGTGGFTFGIVPSGSINAGGLATGLGAGTYTITAIDINGCTGSSVFVLNAPQPMVVNLLNTVNAGCGLNNGSISFNTLGGNPMYTYLLQPGGAMNPTGSFNGLSGNTTYTVLVTDANGCTATGSGLVSQSSPSPISSISTTPSSCLPGNDATLTITMPGAGPYSFLLNPGALPSANGLYTNLPAGTYTIIATDANNCSASSVATITQQTAPLVNSAQATGAGCSPANTGTINVSATGTGSLTYVITPGAISNSTGLFSSLTAGTYTVVVSSAGNCTASTVLVVNGSPSPLVSNVVTLSPPCSNPAGGSIDISGGGGTPPYTFSIGGGYTPTSLFTGLPAATYVVSVKDANGCTGSSVVQLTAIVPPSITLSASQPTCFGSDNGSLTANVTGNGPYSFTLIPGNSNNSSGVFTGLGSGLYIVTVTDGNGCSAQSSASLSNPTAISWLEFSSNGSTCANEHTGTIQSQAQGGSGTYSYTLQPGSLTQSNGQFVELLAGIYTITATDALGCTSTRSIEIEAGRCCDKVFLPNAFTPNGDMLNDEFRIKLSPGFVMESLVIYDRWGKQIFRSTQAFDNWDGRYLGGDCPLGTYFYYYTYVCEDTGKKYAKQGDVLLIR